MKFKIVIKDNFNRESLKQEIELLFKNDDSNIANLKEFMDHLDFIFDKNSDNNSFLVLGYEENQLISMVNFLEYNYLTNYWAMFSLFVKKEYRHKKYAQLVFDKGINELSNYTVNKLFSGSHAENRFSINFHHKNKFRYMGCNWNEVESGFPMDLKAFVLDENIDTKLNEILYNVVNKINNNLVITQRELDLMIDIAINYYNPLETIFRLARSSIPLKLDLDKIEDYYIRKENLDYLLELYSIDSNFNQLRSFNKIINSNSKILFNGLATTKESLLFFTDNHIKEFIKKTKLK